MKCLTRLTSSWSRLLTPTASPTLCLHQCASFIIFNDGNRVPQVGLGTWKSPPGAVGAAVAAALDAGYRHIDCALVYQNEDEIGQVLSPKLSSTSSIRRDDVFLTGKIWNTYHSREKARIGLEKSLRSLQTSYLDLLLIHYPFGFDESGLDANGKPDAQSGLYPVDASGKMRFSDVDYLETYAALESFVAEGLVKSIGVSNFNKAQVQRVLDSCSVKPVTNQVEVHPYFVNLDLIEFCQARDVSITAYSPLGSPDRPNAQSDDPVLLDDPVVKQIATKLNKTPAQVLIRFGMELGLIVIPKSVTPSRIGDNFQVFDFQLNSGEIEALKRLDKGSSGRTCCALPSQTHPHWPFKD